MDLHGLLEVDVLERRTLDEFLREYDFLEDFFDVVKGDTKVDGTENLKIKDHYVTDGGAVGLHCIMGGDWEDPAEFILFINMDREVWYKNLHKGGGEPRMRKNSPSKSRFERTTEMVAQSPINEGCECIGTVDLKDENFNLNGQKT